MGKPVLTLKDLKKLPYATTLFSVIHEKKKVYVDKTAMIARIAETEDAPVFLSRPRRFGKSLLVSAFESLFSKGLQDFKGLDIDTGEDKWTDKTYKVVHLDFSNYASCSREEFKIRLTQALTRRLSDVCSLSPLDEQGNYYDPADIIDQVCLKIADHSLVLLIDEYDSPVTHHLGNKTERDELSAVFSNFFSAIKTWSGKFRFIFITGITRIANVSLFSVFNNLNDISCDDEYATLLGITEEELRRYFDPYVRNAAAVLDMSVSEVYDRMKILYDGFQFSIRTNTTVYNPWSVLSFLSKPQQGFINYWYASSGGTPTILIKYLENTAFLDLFNKLSYRVKDGCLADNLLNQEMLISKSAPDQIPVEMLLYQTGYFTLRKQTRTRAIFAIPNDEVAESFIKLSLDVNRLTPSFATQCRFDDMDILVDSADIAGIFDLFNAALCEGVSSNAKVFDDENTVRDFIYVQLPRSGILKSREKCNVHGYSDMEIKTRTTKLVIEFKRMRKGFSQKAAMKKALDQLRTHDYGVTAEDIKLIQVGMVISPAQKKLVEYQILDE
ncbi:AAA family ATPase [Succinimonas sp.]|uniref:AAA family ATPase n=1 Tax=Succinimonas sp. TaxID=1936151 RepID=UPI0038630209